MNVARRIYPVVQVGDRFGARVVTAILARDATKDERVEWRCECGQWGKSYVFNLRKMVATCTHAKERPRCLRCRLKEPEGIRVRRFCTDGAPCVYESALCMSADSGRKP